MALALGFAGPAWTALLCTPGRARQMNTPALFYSPKYLCLRSYINQAKQDGLRSRDLALLRLAKARCTLATRVPER
jgi:hypothetical protein